MDAHSLAAHGTRSPSFTDTAVPAALNAALAHEFQSRTVADLEQECRQLIQHTALTCIELGKRLCFLKSTVRHGEWMPMLTRIGICDSMGRRMMRAAIKFLSQPDGLRLVEAAKSKTKLLELLTLDEEEVSELARGGAVRGITMDTLPGLTVAKLRAQLKTSDAPRVADVGNFAKVEEPVQTHGQTGASKKTPPGKCADVGTFDAALAQGNRIRSRHAGRLGTVVKVYTDGSACICWDDGEPQAEGLGHERVSSELLVKDATAPKVTVDRKCAGDGTFESDEGKSGVDAAFAGSTPQADTPPNNVISLISPQHERRKQYCRELCRVLLRYASEAETRDLVHLLEDVVADQLASRYSPGLNAAAYDVFARYGLKGGAL